MMDEIDDATQELFYGEWKNDKRNGQVWVSVLVMLTFFIIFCGGINFCLVNIEPQSTEN